MKIKTTQQPAFIFTAYPTLIRPHKEGNPKVVYKFVVDNYELFWETNNYLDTAVQYTIKATLRDLPQGNPKQKMLAHGKILKEHCIRYE